MSANTRSSACTAGLVATPRGHCRCPLPPRKSRRHSWTRGRASGASSSRRMAIGLPMRRLPQTMPSVLKSMSRPIRGRALTCRFPPRAGRCRVGETTGERCSIEAATRCGGGHRARRRGSSRPAEDAVRKALWQRLRRRAGRQALSHDQVQRVGAAQSVDVRRELVRGAEASRASQATGTHQLSPQYGGCLRARSSCLQPHPGFIGDSGCQGWREPDEAAFLVIRGPACRRRIGEWTSQGERF